MSVAHRGVTLVEMLVAITLLALVSGVALQFLLRQQWAAEAQTQRAALQSNLRTGVHYLETEIRELGGSGAESDVIAFAAESLGYRAMRGAGVSCGLSPNALSVRTADWSGYRAPQPGRDSLLVYVESSDGWIHLPIVAVSGGSCGGSPALVLSTSIDTAANPLSGFSPLVPFRSFEIMQLKLYLSAGDYWLGARSVSAPEIIQPFAGPFQQHGLVLDYQDSVGAPATAASSIRSVGITLRGQTASATRTGAGMGQRQRWSDSLLTRVTLRNW